MFIEASTSIMLLISSFYIPASAAQATQFQIPIASASKQTSAAMIADSAQSAKADKPKTLKQYVEDYFKDDPILIEIASCESNFRQVDANGDLLRGAANDDDVGVMQINEKYHYDRAKKLGLDIRTLEGNLAYAKWLYDNQGLKPWNSSSKCWVKAVSRNIQSQILAKN